MVVSVALWMWFFYWIWGSPFPSVVYGTQHPVRWEYFVRGGPGLLFDQEYGIVPAAPIFGAALVGLAAMLWSGGRARRVAAEIAVHLRRAADPGRRVPPLVGRIRRDRPAGDCGGPAARPADRLAGAACRIERRRGRVAGAAGRGQRGADALPPLRAEGAAAGRRPRRRVAPAGVLVAVMASLVAGAFVPDAGAGDRVGLHRGLADRVRGRGARDGPAAAPARAWCAPDWPRAAPPAGPWCWCR